MLNKRRRYIWLRHSSNRRWLNAQGIRRLLGSPSLVLLSYLSSHVDPPCGGLESRPKSFEQHVDTPVTRRTIVRTGAKLAYVAPLVAMTMHVSAIGGSAQETCDCSRIVGGTFDPTPYGGGDPACCTCEHCKTGGRGGRYGDVLYPGAFYIPNPVNAALGGICGDPTRPNGFSTAYCAPICTPCGDVESPSTPK